MSTPRPLWSTGQVAAQRFNRAYPGLQGGRRAGLAPVEPRLAQRRRRRVVVPDPGGWIQPPDELEVTYGPGWSVSVAGDPVAPADYTAEIEATVNLLRDAPVGAYGTSYSHIGNLSTATPVSRQTFISLSEAGLALLRVSPDPPPGYEVEYEALRGVVQSIRLVGLVYIESNVEGRGIGGKIRRVPEGMYTAGTIPEPTYYKPGELSTMSIEATISGASSSVPYPTATIDETITLDSNDCVMYVAHLDAQISATWPLAAFAWLYVSAVDPDRLRFEVTYRPPRYRFVPV